MIKVKWDIEEAVALYSLYIRYGFPIPGERTEQLSLVLRNRAEKLGIKTDDKFRNISGLKMQSACIEYVATNGKNGLSSASKLFYQVHELYKNERSKFDLILNNFIREYGEF